jgi:hypothetical protein
MDHFLGDPAPAEIGEFAAAFVKAQAEFNHPQKSQEGKVTSTRSYKYADLKDTIDAVRPALNKNGISVLQLTRYSPDGDGTFYIHTILLHESGQRITSDYPVPLLVDPQQQGSVITYAKRYALAAICCVSGEDDDDGARGALGRNGSEQDRQRRPQPKAPPRKKQQQPAAPQQPAKPKASSADIEFFQAITALKRRLLAAYERTGNFANPKESARTTYYETLQGFDIHVEHCTELGSGLDPKEKRALRGAFYDALEKRVKQTEAASPKEGEEVEF